MKIKMLFLAAAFAIAQVAGAQSSGDGVDECATDTIQRAPNPLIEVLTVPFKMVVALTHGPRCLLDSIPRNEQ